MNEFKKVRMNSFTEKQSYYKQQVKEANEGLFNALDVTLERTENTELIPNWELIAAQIPGIMKRSSHIGYAETNNLDDVAEAFALVVKNGAYVVASKDGWVYPDMLWSNKHNIEQAIERNKTNNLTSTGRYLAKFNYLLNKQHDTSSIEVPQGL